MLNAGEDPHLVKARRNRSPARWWWQVVLADSEFGRNCQSGGRGRRSDLLSACRRTLAAHKVPAQLRFVPALGWAAPASWCAWEPV